MNKAAKLEGMSESNNASSDTTGCELHTSNLNHLSIYCRILVYFGGKWVY